jgi:hypothetical protein
MIASFRSNNQALKIIIIYILFFSTKLSHLTYLEFFFFLNNTLYNHSHLQERGIFLPGSGPATPCFQGQLVSSCIMCNLNKAVLFSLVEWRWWLLVTLDRTVELTPCYDFRRMVAGGGWSCHRALFGLGSIFQSLKLWVIFSRKKQNFQWDSGSNQGDIISKLCPSVFNL